jgi:alpha-1,3-glucosyltransferase
MSESYIVILFWGGLLVRVLMAFSGHSGQGVPPMYGDYEAQRHWMEITTNLPLGEWYQHGPLNNLQYWGLDYPPLTAYVSYVFGKMAQFAVPELVALQYSRGCETVVGKFFMRFSVILCDAFVYIPTCIMVAVFLMTNLQDSTSSSKGNFVQRLSSLLLERKRNKSNNNKRTYDKWDSGMITLAVALILHPGLLLIDHGHFQYNGVCIGLALAAMWYILSGDEVLGSVMFCLSLNFKQMALYYAPVFFFALLGGCLVTAATRGVGAGAVRLSKIGVSVVATFGVMWAPFCLYPGKGATCASSLLQVVHRLFPFARGIFEDKVANLWYALSVVVDFREFADATVLVRCSLGLTLLLLGPVCYTLLIAPWLARKKSSNTSSNSEVAPPISFVLALVVSSLAFFLASFQVHEKSLLLSSVPAMALLTTEPLFVMWFQTLALFTMHPLLQKDELNTPYAICFGLCLSLVAWVGLSMGHDDATIDKGKHRLPLAAKSAVRAFRAFVALSTVGMVILHALEALLPSLLAGRYPDLYPALFSIYGAANLLVAYLGFSYWLVSSSSASGDRKKAQKGD